MWDMYDSSDITVFSKPGRKFLVSESVRGRGSFMIKILSVLQMSLFQEINLQKKYMSR